MISRFKNSDFYIALGTLVVLTFVAKFISSFEFFSRIGFSLLIVSILIGMFLTNILKVQIPKKYDSGFAFATKELLRFAIILYGFRLTFTDILDVGFIGISTSFLIVFLIFSIGYIIGTKVLKIDKEIVILTSAGSSICGAAAVLATEGVLKNKAYKTSIAISTVVLFGTISMFVYPYLYKFGFIDFTHKQMAIYLGATLHEVAHVVGAANSLENEIISNNAIIVKMLRVMFLAPFLIVLSIFLFKNKDKKSKTTITIPWFAVFFILVAGFNSFGFVGQNIISYINEIDTFFLAMAMMALGLKTDFNTLKQVGIKPLILASILFICLFILGYILVYVLSNFS